MSSSAGTPLAWPPSASLRSTLQACPVCRDCLVCSCLPLLTAQPEHLRPIGDAWPAVLQSGFRAHGAGSCAEVLEVLPNGTLRRSTASSQDAPLVALDPAGQAAAGPFPHPLVSTLGVTPATIEVQTWVHNRRTSMLWCAAWTALAVAGSEAAS